MRPLLIINVNLNPRTTEGCRAIRDSFRALSPGISAVIMPWATVTPAAVRRLRPRGVVLGPNETPFPAYPANFDAFLSWVRARRGPTLGICGGHQVLALAHGSPIGPVHRVPAARTSYAGMPKVTGARTVRQLGDPDPLLDGIPDEFSSAASHVDEVKELPPGFRLLAIGDPCHVQIIRADRRPMWGVQFHPEKDAGGDPAGTQLLRNYLAVTAQ